MSRDAKKNRHRLKRQEKQRHLRLVKNASPYRRIGAAGEVKACYINRDWQEQHMASIFCIRAVPGGGFAMAAFLVDTGCMGLKDAWGRLDISMEEFRERILIEHAELTELVRVDIDVIRRLVAGGIRFARQNGFRLPSRYDRWTALLGDIGDVAAANLGDFGVDGKLYYIGPIEDLQRRLVSGTAEDFLSREDVEFIGGVRPEDLGLADDEDDFPDDDDEFADDDDDFLEDDDAEEIEEVLQSLKQKGLEGVRRWCFANGIAPHPRLGDAIDMITEVFLQTTPADEALLDEGSSEPGLSEKQAELASGNFQRLLSLENEQTQKELWEAMSQCTGFMSQFESPEAMIEALGLPSEDGSALPPPTA